MVDLEKERVRLQGELDKVISEIKRAEGKLNNKGFTDKAPKNLVDAEKAKLEKYNEMKCKIEEQLKEL